MEFHERMATVHAQHAFWNPVSEEAVAHLIAALDLEPEDRVLDIACGPGELLVRIAERYGCGGTGVDISPWAIETARAKAAARVPEAGLQFVEGAGEAYDPGAAAPPDAVCLVGASWIWQGYDGTLDALLRWLAPDGVLLFGEPYWRTSDVPLAFCEAEGVKPESFTTLEGIREAAAARSLRLVTMVGSSEQDWDRYEMLQSLAADRWARAHPKHEARAELLEDQARHRSNYLRYGRDVLGFAQFVFRRDGT